MSLLRGARVLVVEDEALLSLNLETMLLDMDGLRRRGDGWQTRRRLADSANL